jgi:hypothetical protein
VENGQRKLSFHRLQRKEAHPAFYIRHGEENAGCRMISPAFLFTALSNVRTMA